MNAEGLLILIGLFLSGILALLKLFVFVTLGWWWVLVPIMATTGIWIFPVSLDADW